MDDDLIGRLDHGCVYTGGNTLGIVDEEKTVKIMREAAARIKQLTREEDELVPPEFTVRDLRAMLPYVPEMAKEVVVEAAARIEQLTANGQLAKAMAERDAANARAEVAEFHNTLLRDDNRHLQGRAEAAMTALREISAIPNSEAAQGIMKVIARAALAPQQAKAPERCPRCNLNWQLNPPAKISGSDKVLCIDCKDIFHSATPQQAKADTPSQARGES
jgi:hypothetical protein